jgi:WhiB family transcriptional regulator, redox-sensing transcriptional regulator
MFESNNDGASLWQDSAYCQNANTDQFFSNAKGKELREDIAYAKGICAQCPVKSFCLNDAILYGYEGVWGGTTEKERRKIPAFKVKMLREDAQESGTFNYILKS